MNIENFDGPLGREYFIADAASVTTLLDMVDMWCLNTVGPANYWGGSNTTWKRLDQKYYFAREIDRDLFVLAWA
jgi:hypothetical protein